MQASWPKVVARKWLNMNSGAEEYHSDYRTKGRFSSQFLLFHIFYIFYLDHLLILHQLLKSAFSYMSERRKSCSDEARSVVVPEELSGKRRLPQIYLFLNYYDLK